MADIIGPHQTEATAYFCPKCHNPITILGFSLTLSKRVVACGACDWGGTEDQLAQSSFKHGFLSDDEIMQTMMRDLRNLLAKTVAQSYGSFLLKWGFLDQPISGLQIAHYIDAIAKSVVTTIIETRKTLVEEKARERSGVPAPTRSKD